MFIMHLLVLFAYTNKNLVGNNSVLIVGDALIPYFSIINNKKAADFLTAIFVFEK
jgi:hypothetical protein